MTKLYIVATPIGNLGDFSSRAIETLKQVRFILCEDTRNTQKLLNHFEIKTPTISYHHHSKIHKVDKVLELLEKGNDLALVSDAGTPGIADPGNKLIQEVIEKIGDSVEIIPISGPSALTTVASIAGFSMDRFLFLGFPPAKNKRKKFFEQVATSQYPVILYESPHRILKTLNDLSACTELSSVQVVVSRELTKKFETTYRGTPEQVIDQLKNSTIKGEFVIVVNNC